MNIILDSNVLFSALIKDSITRKLILEYDGCFLFPAYIFDEFEKHKQDLLEKMKMSGSDSENLLNLLLKKVLIVPNEKLLEYKETAMQIIGTIDVDDVLFFACALAYPNSIIWSDDKALKRQNQVVVLNTAEIKEYFEQIDGEKLI